MSTSWSCASSSLGAEPSLQLGQHSGKSLLSKLKKTDPTLGKKYSCEFLAGRLQVLCMAQVSSGSHTSTTTAHASTEG